MSEAASRSDLLEGARPADPLGRLAPGPEELLAIALAVEECWPRAGGGEPSTRWNRGTPVWRFSGRWWTRPATMRRDRPLG